MGNIVIGACVLSAILIVLAVTLGPSSTNNPPANHKTYILNKFQPASNLRVDSFNNIDFTVTLPTSSTQDGTSLNMVSIPNTGAMYLYYSYSDDMLYVDGRVFTSDYTKVTGITVGNLLFAVKYNTISYVNLEKTVYWVIYNITSVA